MYPNCREQKEHCMSSKSFDSSFATVCHCSHLLEAVPQPNTNRPLYPLPSLHSRWSTSRSTTPRCTARAAPERTPSAATTDTTRKTTSMGACTGAHPRLPCGRGMTRSTAAHPRLGTMPPCPQPSCPHCPQTTPMAVALRQASRRHQRCHRRHRPIPTVT